MPELLLGYLWVSVQCARLRWRRMWLSRFSRLEGVVQPLAPGRPRSVDNVACCCWACREWPYLPGQEPAARPKPVLGTYCDCCAQRRSSARTWRGRQSSCTTAQPALAAKAGASRLVFLLLPTRSLLGPDLVPKRPFFNSALNHHPELVTLPVVVQRDHWPSAENGDRSIFRDCSQSASLIYHCAVQVAPPALIRIWIPECCSVSMLETLLWCRLRGAWRSFENCATYIGAVGAVGAVHGAPIRHTTTRLKKASPLPTC